MRDASKLLEWEYMIYLLPCGIAAFLLLISSLRLGHRGGHGHSHGGHGGMRVAHGGAGLRSGATGHSHGQSGHTTHTAGSAGKAVSSHSGHPSVRARLGKVEVSRHGPRKENVTITTNFIVHILGADRAPLIMIVEAFCLVWGVTGYWANQTLLHTDNPTFAQMLPSFGVAFGCGIVGARVAAEIIGRVMPQDESQVVSQDSLFGLTGKVAFPVSESSGRIHIYDAFGTLHDEMCRLAPDHPLIEKGHRAMVVDKDAQGRLIVEEVPESVK